MFSEPELDELSIYMDDDFDDFDEDFDDDFFFWAEAGKATSMVSASADRIIEILFMAIA